MWALHGFHIQTKEGKCGWFMSSVKGISSKCWDPNLLQGTDSFTWTGPKYCKMDVEDFLANHFSLGMELGDCFVLHSFLCVYIDATLKFKLLNVLFNLITYIYLF